MTSLAAWVTIGAPVIGAQEGDLMQRLGLFSAAQNNMSIVDLSCADSGRTDVAPACDRNRAAL